MNYIERSMENTSENNCAVGADYVNCMLAATYPQQTHVMLETFHHVESACVNEMVAALKPAGTKVCFGVMLKMSVMTTVSLVTQCSVCGG